MGFTQFIKRVLRPVTAPVLERITERVTERIRPLIPPPPPPPISPEIIEGNVSAPFDLQLLMVARTVAASGDHRILSPAERGRPRKRPEEVKIGFFGNMANNAYNFTKCLRRLGYDAELVIEEDWFDTFLMNRPFWEDVEVECSSYEEGLKHESRWNPPEYVRRVKYDFEAQMRYQGRYAAAAEAQAKYREEFGIELPLDRALLLAQHMGHWPYIREMKRYDVVQLSSAPIMMGLFCPKPYVVFPTGGDLFITPFEETMVGQLTRAAYKNAAHILYCETNYPEFLDRLGPLPPRTFAPMMVDTDTYAPGDGGEMKTRWEKATGGRKFLLNVCRQSWEWKGNDRLIRSFGTFLKQGNEDWRLIILEWGTDVEKTKELIAQLGIADKILWEKLSSKPVLRKRQQAADLVADQFVMAGYGTSVLESMASGKGVLMTYDPEGGGRHFDEPPPFLTATTEKEIAMRLANLASLEDHGSASRDWVERVHGYRRNAPRNYLPALIATGGGEGR